MVGGQVLHYHIIREIGHGAVGRVYHAVDTRLERDVALKFLRTTGKLEDEEDEEARFLVEARAAAKLDHPNICNIHTIEAYEDSFFIVMALYQGQGLDARMRQAQGSLLEVLALFRQILLGIRHAHSRNIIHRDIKPSNIFVTDDNIVKVLDFGLARMPDSNLTQDGQVMGTLKYSSPEQIRGESMDVRSDIWSLGVLLFEMITGVLPFAGKFPQVVMEVLQEKHRSLSKYLHQPALEALIDGCLAKNKQQRTASCDDLLARLDALEVDSSVQIITARQRIAQTRQAAMSNTSSIPSSIPSSNTTTTLTSYSQMSSSLIGREADVATIRDMLLNNDNTLLSIVGIGGAGKTSVAQQMEHDRVLNEHFHDGVHFVALDALHDAEQIPSLIAQAFDMTLHIKEPWQQLYDILAATHSLVILDNFEHLIDSSAMALAELLERCPRLSLLVTTRELLKLSDEIIYDLQGLSLPEDSAADFMEYGATTLFIKKAKRLRHDFDVAAHKASILRICQKLEGWPLGIELAVAWIRQLSPDDIASQLEQNLDLLTSQSRNSIPRHQSAHAAFEHSWQLLDASEQEALACLAIFHDGFDGEAAYQVVGIGLPILASLLDKSLITMGERRYTQHPLLRQFCEQKFVARGDVLELEKAHASYYLKLAVRAHKDLAQGNDELMWRIRLRHDRLNINMAIQNMVAREEAAIAMQLCMAIYNLEELRVKISIPSSDALLPTLIMLSHKAGDSKTRAILLYIAALRLWLIGELQESRQLYQESLQIGEDLNDIHILSRALHQLALLEISAGDYVQAEHYASQGIHYRRDLDDRAGLSLALRGLSRVYTHQGNYAMAQPLLLEALEVAEHSGNQAYTIESLHALAFNYMHRENYEKAWELLHRADAIYQTFNGTDILVDAHLPWGYYWLLQGDLAQATQAYQQDLQIAIRRKNDKMRGIILRSLGHIACLENGVARAKAYVYEALRLGYRDRSLFELALALHGVAAYLALRQQWEESLLLWSSIDKAQKHYDFALYTYACGYAEEMLILIEGELEARRYQTIWQQGQETDLQNVAAMVLQEKVLVEPLEMVTY